MHLKLAGVRHAKIIDSKRIFLDRKSTTRCLRPQPFSYQTPTVTMGRKRVGALEKVDADLSVSPSSIPFLKLTFTVQTSSTKSDEIQSKSPEHF